MTNRVRRVPAALEQLVEVLDLHGYRRRGTLHSLGFGDTVQSFYKGSILAQVTRDRMVWSVRVGIENGPLYEGDLWRACLAGGDAPVPPRQLRSQVTYIKAHIHDIEDALLGDRRDVTLECLRSRSWARVKRYLASPSQ